jgi:hypothetical protein
MQHQSNFNRKTVNPIPSLSNGWELLKEVTSGANFTFRAAHTRRQSRQFIPRNRL